MVIWLVVGVVLALSNRVDAATVRGRLLRRGKPAPLLTVTLLGQLGRSSPTTSASDGMFYLLNVPPGCYTLEVWADRKEQPAVSFANHCVKDPLTDIPPVQLSF